MKTHVKNKHAFMLIYDKFLSELVFYKDLPDNKVEVKIAIPRYSNYVKQILNKIP